VKRLLGETLERNMGPSQDGSTRRIEENIGEHFEIDEATSLEDLETGNRYRDSQRSDIGSPIRVKDEAEIEQRRLKNFNADTDRTNQGKNSGSSDNRKNKTPGVNERQSS